MSKLIKMTPDVMEEARKEFEEALLSGKFSNGKINFTKTLGATNRKATVFFTELAWIKMQTLIREFDKEIAWHGIAYRGDDKTKDEYYITDILIYPQEVTGATVNTDQVRYETWLMNHDDEVFDNIRMQGHSHVNMSTAPSGVDTTLYEEILYKLKDDMFYIFMIWNKKKEKTFKIYDLAKNVLFETNDVEIEIVDDGTGVEKFLKSAKEMVVEKPTTYGSASSYQGYTYCKGYGAAGNYYNGYSHSQKKDEPQKADQNAGKQSSGKKKRCKSKNKSNATRAGNNCNKQLPSAPLSCGDENLNQYI